MHVAEYIKGGVATILNELIVYQKNTKSIDVSVLVNAAHVEYLEDKEVYSYTGSRGFLGLLSFAVAIVKCFFKEKPDIVHLHSSFAGLVGRVVLLPFRVKIIYHPHGVSFDSARSSGLSRLCLSFVEKFLALKCTGIIAISEYELNELAKVLPNKKLYLVNNGVSDLISYIPNYQRNGRLLFVGRFDQQKGLDLLLNHYKNTSNNLPLDIVGAAVLADSSLDEDIHNVNILGWKSGSELEELYSTYSAVVMPSRWEGFGLVAIEAMRSGTPVISSDKGALPYIVKNGVNGFIVNLEAFSDNFQKQLNIFKNVDYEVMSNEARNTFIDNYTAFKMCEGILDVYGIRYFPQR